MTTNQPRFIKRCAQWLSKNESKHIPPATRGIYALLDRHEGTENYDVVYVGMTARSSMGRRIARHKLSKPKGWSHFSIFEVWDEITEDEIRELEGLFREVYRKDSQANRLNRVGKFDRLQNVRNDKIKSWK